MFGDGTQAISVLSWWYQKGVDLLCHLGYLLEWLGEGLWEGLQLWEWLECLLWEWLDLHPVPCWLHLDLLSLWGDLP